jgi:hypothetical protein
MSKKIFGWDNLAQRVAEEAASTFLAQRSYYTTATDSEIEALMLAALSEYAARQIDYTLHMVNRLTPEKGRDLFGRGPKWGEFAVQTQVNLQDLVDINWRVDFLFSAPEWKTGEYDADKMPLYDSWRQLIVECDGHDFHERTKEQAKRDRTRDRQAQEKDLTIYRFTGSEIFNDPWGCAAQVFKWAEQDL